jgi:hypothetical protein
MLLDVRNQHLHVKIGGMVPVHFFEPVENRLQFVEIGNRIDPRVKAPQLIDYRLGVRIIIHGSGPTIVTYGPASLHRR